MTCQRSSKPLVRKDKRDHLSVQRVVRQNPVRRLKVSAAKDVFLPQDTLQALGLASVLLPAEPTAATIERVETTETATISGRGVPNRRTIKAKQTDEVSGIISEATSADEEFRP